MLLRTIFKSHFSNFKIPSVDLTRYINQEKGWEQDCEKIADSLHKYGLLYIKDPRINPEHNNTFLDLMENYFVKRSIQLS